MLKRMTLTNFLSFKEETVIEFSQTKYGILNTTNVSDTGVLKGGLFIGPNASGKSNILKGIKFLLNFLLGEMKNYDRYCCLFSPNPSMVLEYDLLIEGSDINYKIEYNKKGKILEEHLYIDNEEILNRIDKSGTIILKKNKITDNNLEPTTSYLRRAAFETGDFPQNKVLSSFMSFIKNSYYIDIHRLSYFRNLDLDQYIETNGVERINGYLKELKYDFSMEYGSRIAGSGFTWDLGDEKEIFLKRNNFDVPIPLGMESLGNQVFTNLLPGLIGTTENNGMFIIDEFSSGLHNMLEEKIIRFFMKNTKNSQLFFTSHSTNLISNSIMRPDQIYLVTLEGPKGSSVKRISDYKPREAQNIEKMYLSGVFEGLPDYGEKI
ncbi:MAG: ATP/GTP-binding protein [Clostridiaceae bacterium]